MNSFIKKYFWDRGGVGGENEVIAAVQLVEVKISGWGRSEGNVKLGIFFTS